MGCPPAKARLLHGDGLGGREGPRGSEGSPNLPPKSCPHQAAGHDLSCGMGGRTIFLANTQHFSTLSRCLCPCLGVFSCVSQSRLDFPFSNSSLTSPAEKMRLQRGEILCMGHLIYIPYRCTSPVIGHRIIFLHPGGHCCAWGRRAACFQPSTPPVFVIFRIPLHRLMTR